ncbi:UNVERIFIED_CONTAM: hypothetical protein GTU68_015963 [Idotea baltica]|nr:hypothetical protein [Idotea baltica]
MTPLHQCCIEGYTEMASLLLQHGASVNTTDIDGWTPLHAAATCGHKDIVELLVRTGADLLASNNDEDMPFEITEDEETLVFLEREMTYQGITERIVLERGRATHASLKRDILNALHEGQDLDAPVTTEAATFLHVAIGSFYNDLVKILLKNQASDTVEDEDGWRPIHVAAYWGNEEAFRQLVKQRKTDIRVETRAGDTCYDLCEDAELKSYIKQLLNVYNSSPPIHNHTRPVDLNLNERQTTQKDDNTDQLDTSTERPGTPSYESPRPRRLSVENLPHFFPKWGNKWIQYFFYLHVKIGSLDTTIDLLPFSSTYMNII